MTDDVKLYGFLLGQKPICTQSPIKTALGPERHRELRAKYKLELGIDLLDDRCDNVFNCKIKGSGCIGRPFPVDPEIKEALSTINVNVTEGVHKGRDVYFAEAVVDCSQCPFQQDCEAPCASLDSFLKRRVAPDPSPKSNMLVSYDDYEKGMFGPVHHDIERETTYTPNNDWADQQLPLDCLTSKQRQVLEMTLYDNLEQPVIAHKMNITKQRVSRLLQSAKSRLEEFGKARKVIKESNLVPKRVIEYYINNLTQQEIADKEDVSKQYISDYINKWRESNGLS